jgi:transposase InsO family protein
LQTIPVT